MSCSSYAACVRVSQFDTAERGSFTHIDSCLGRCLPRRFVPVGSFSAETALSVARRPNRASARQNRSRTAASALNRAVYKATKCSGGDGQASINYEEEPLPDTVCYTDTSRGGAGRESASLARCVLMSPSLFRRLPFQFGSIFHAPYSNSAHAIDLSGCSFLPADSSAPENQEQVAEP